MLKNELIVGKEFETIRYNRKFQASFESIKSREGVSVIPMSGCKRGPIPRNEFKGVWDNLKILDKNKI